MKNETIFFNMCATRGRTDTHLAKSLHECDILNERFVVSPQDHDQCNNVCKCKYDQMSVARSLP